MLAEQLQKMDLIPGKIYEHDTARPNTLTALMRTKKDYSSTPVHGGFRVSAVQDGFRAIRGQRAFLVITSGDVKRRDNSWKDDIVDNRLVYFGDNLKYDDPGESKGNKRLVDIFAHGRLDTKDVYPLFFFRLLGERQIQYVGICYPISDGLSTISQNGVHNFKAEFSVDQESIVTKRWLTDLKEGHWADSIAAPDSWKAYLEDGVEGARQYIESQLSNRFPDEEFVGETSGIRETSVRLTQEKFRQRLFVRQHQCLICGIVNESLLVASHIKPWAESNDEERMDPNNGIILCALHDRLFDRHFISFDSDGNLKISRTLTTQDAMRCGLIDGRHYQGLVAHQEYLNYHRDAFAWKEQNLFG